MHGLVLPARMIGRSRTNFVSVARVTAAGVHENTMTNKKGKRFTQTECSLLYRLKRGPVFPMNKSEHKACQEMEKSGWLNPRSDDGFYALTDVFMDALTNGTAIVLNE